MNKKNIEKEAQKYTSRLIVRLEFSSIKKELNKLYAEELVREYGNSIMLFDRLDIEGGKTWGSKNSTIVRSIHVIKSHAERIRGND